MLARHATTWWLAVIYSLTYGLRPYLAAQMCLIVVVHQCKLLLMLCARYAVASPPSLAMHGMCIWLAACWLWVAGDVSQRQQRYLSDGPINDHNVQWKQPSAAALVMQTVMGKKRKATSVCDCVPWSHAHSISVIINAGEALLVRAGLEHNWQLHIQ